ncbi:aldo/keto reductase [Luteimonas deserti]|uniref:aldo/keto reductase n=1 Tax=Luteimonas deserti TaxID=2752306 RepID=UPI002E2AE3D3|nr:aldo/keto reductase [Luteimonas deserti]
MTRPDFRSVTSDRATAPLGDRRVKRIGYGAMQHAGPGVMGPPEDPAAAMALLREAVELGVDHIDTSDAYGPHANNRLVREALHPDAESLAIVTKVGAIRGVDGAWLTAQSSEDIRQVHDNLRLEVLDVVNLRSMFDVARRSTVRWRRR